MCERRTRRHAPSVLLQFPLAKVDPEGNDRSMKITCARSSRVALLACSVAIAGCNRTPSEPASGSAVGDPAAAAVGVNQPNKAPENDVKSSNLPAANPLVGKIWTLTVLSGVPIAAERLPTLEFTDGRVSGFGGINRISGAYAIKADELSFGPMISTRMAGDPVLMSLEDNFMKALGSVDGWAVSGSELSFLSKGTAVATFRNGP